MINLFFFLFRFQYINFCAIIFSVIRPYVSPLGTFPSPKLESALTRLCQALADLIRLCDTSMIAGETCSALDQVNVQQITEEVQKAVEVINLIN